MPRPSSGIAPQPVGGWSPSVPRSTSSPRVGRARLSPSRSITNWCLEPHDLEPYRIHRPGFAAGVDEDELRRRTAAHVGEKFPHRRSEPDDPRLPCFLRRLVLGKHELILAEVCPLQCSDFLRACAGLAKREEESAEVCGRGTQQSVIFIGAQRPLTRSRFWPWHSLSGLRGRSFS